VTNDDGRNSRLGGPFWILLWSSSASNLADGVLRIALPLTAIRFTRSPATIGALELTRSVAWLLLVLPVGAWTDRWDRRITMVSSNVLRVIATALLAAALVFDRGSLAVIFLAAAAAGMAEVFYDTAAQSILTAVVQRRQLGRANSRLAILERGTQEYIAPALGGLLVALSVVLGAAVPAALWFAALLGLLVLRGSFRPERTGDRATALADVREGLRFVWRRPVLRTLAGIVGLGNLTTSASMAVLVLYAVGPDSPMGMSEKGYGALFLISGVGAVVAATTNEWIVVRLGDARTMRWATPALVLRRARDVGRPARCRRVHGARVLRQHDLQHPLGLLPPTRHTRRVPRTRQQCLPIRRVGPRCHSVRSSVA
jgi:MFS family permease